MTPGSFLVSCKGFLSRHSAWNKYTNDTIIQTHIALCMLSKSGGRPKKDSEWVIGLLELLNAALECPQLPLAAPSQEKAPQYTTSGLTQCPFLPLWRLLLLVSINQGPVSQQIDILIAVIKSDLICFSAGLCWSRYPQEVPGRLREGECCWQYSLPIRRPRCQSQKTSRLFANQRTFSLQREPCRKCF